MKIAITAKTSDLDSEIDPRFGRCSYFLVIETEDMSYKSISNESQMASGGAGIQAAQTIAQTGVQVLITGNVGPNAFQTLNAAGIDIFIGVTGNVKNAVEKYKKGELKKTQSPSVDSHFGMRGSGRGFNRGGNL